MSKTFKYLAAFITIASISPAMSHLALDHLKHDLDSRFKDVYSSKELDAAHKASALTQIRYLQSRYSSAVSLDRIPSQKEAADKMCQELNREIRNFDNTLRGYKAASKGQKAE